MIGIDEVGRGAWAGPLLVCAVRLHNHIDGLADSKVVSKKRREVLAIQIQENADIGFGWVEASEIDEIGLSAALKLGALRAITAIQPVSGERIIIDGTIDLLPGQECVETLVKADATVPCVSAASIAAKVARDAHMQKAHTSYPLYGFATHVGYGTAEHAAAISKNGLCAEHRLSFKLPKQQ